MTGQWAREHQWGPASWLVAATRDQQVSSEGEWYSNGSRTDNQGGMYLIMGNMDRGNKKGGATSEKIQYEQQA